jgi:adenosylcobinamide-GDP ribazoletransferase
MARTGLPGVPMAAASSLGRTVAGTVSLPWLAAWWLAGAALIVGAALPAAGPADALRLLGAAGAAMVAAELLQRRAVARLGGVTGDVMGAMGETATTTCLLVAAALWV